MLYNNSGFLYNYTMTIEKGLEMFKDLIDSKAIYYFVAVAVLVVVSLAIDYSRFEECRAHGFSIFFCLTL
mgnify:FL=1